MFGEAGEGANWAVQQLPDVRKRDKRTGPIGDGFCRF